MRRVAAIVGAFCVAVGVGGCALGSSTASSGSFTGVKGTVAVTLNALSNDSSSNDSKDLCANVLDARIVKQLGGTSSCQTAITAQLKTIDDFSLAVKSISLSGKTATARVQVEVAGKKQIQSVLLHHDAAGWRVNSVL